MKDIRMVFDIDKDSLNIPAVSGNIYLFIYCPSPNISCSPGQTLYV